MKTVKINLNLFVQHHLEQKNSESGNLILRLMSFNHISKLKQLLKEASSTSLRVTILKSLLPTNQLSSSMILSTKIRKKVQKKRKNKKRRDIS